MADEIDAYYDRFPPSDTAHTLDLLFAALASADRLRLLNDVITGRAEDATALQELTGWEKSRVSKQLKELHHGGRIVLMEVSGQGK